MQHRLLAVFCRSPSGSWHHFQQHRQRRHSCKYPSDTAAGAAIMWMWYNTTTKSVMSKQLLVVYAFIHYLNQPTLTDAVWITEWLWCECALFQCFCNVCCVWVWVGLTQSLTQWLTYSYSLSESLTWLPLVSPRDSRLESQSHSHSFTLSFSRSGSLSVQLILN